MCILMSIATIGFLIDAHCLREKNDAQAAEILKYAEAVEQEQENVAQAKLEIKEREKEVEILQADLLALQSSKAKYLGSFKITYYCACEQCCGKATGITASGAKVQSGVTIAADTNLLPFGTKVYIQGIGERVVQDRGGAIKGNVIDVYVPSHDYIPSVGTHYSDVWLVDYV